MLSEELGAVSLRLESQPLADLADGHLDHLLAGNKRPENDLQSLSTDLIEISFQKTRLQIASSLDKLEESDVVIRVQCLETFQREFHCFMLLHFLWQCLDLSECVSFVEVQEDVIGPELCLIGTQCPRLLEIMIHVLQCPKTLGQVLIIKLSVKVEGTLLTKSLSAENVEPSTFLHNGQRHKVSEVLLSNVLPDGPGDTPHVLVPVTHRLLRLVVRVKLSPWICG